MLATVSGNRFWRRQIQAKGCAVKSTEIAVLRHLPCVTGQCLRGVGATEMQRKQDVNGLGSNPGRHAGSCSGRGNALSKLLEQ